MDSSRHGYQDQYAGKEPTQWAAINRSSYQADTFIDLSPRGSVAVQTTIANMPVVKPAGSPSKPAVANTPRVILPRPNPVLKSQQSDLRPCLACGRARCILSSHRHFAEQLIAKRKLRQPVTPTKPRMPVRPPAQGHIRPPDQFVHYPIAMDAERHQLWALWSQDWSRVRRGPERHLFPTPWIDRVMPTAMSHAPLFQALLATSASMCAMAHNTLSDASARHLQLADEMLAQTCTNETIACKDDCLLAALLLTLVHQAQGNTHETDRRFFEVVRLVNLRGGPYYLGMAGALADVLLYVDYLQATFLDCEPVWKMPLPALQIGMSPPRLGAAFRELNTAHAFNVDLLMAADTLCRTTDIFAQLSVAPGSASGSMNAFGYLSMISEYQLAHYNAVFHGSNTWNECVCLALLLFNHIVLRHDGAITAPVRKIEHQFWQTVDNTIVRGGFREVPPCLLLWLLITGLSSCIVSECQYRPSAVRRMRAARISAAITDWEHFQHRVLDDFIWMRAAQEETFHGVWLEMEGPRAVH